jgi:hypothetical protein
MSLRDDIEVALRLFEEPLSSATKPTENEAKAAASRVVHAITDLILKIKDDITNDVPILSEGLDEILTELPGLSVFLIALSFGFTPGYKNKVYTRKINFTDATQGSTRTRAARARHWAIAERVYLLRKAGEKGAVRKVARENDMDPSEVSRICADPDIKLVMSKREKQS